MKFRSIAAVVWASIAIFLLGPLEDSWMDSSGQLGAGFGVRVRTCGVLRYLTITTLPVTVGGSRGAGYTTAWQWRPTRTVATGLAAGIVTIGAVELCRRGVRSGRLRGRCDECGYDLRGAPGDVCPECGMAISGASR